MLRPMLWNANWNVADPFEEIDRFFDDFWNNGTAVQTTTKNEKTKAPMRTDVTETNNAYILEADLPGFTREELHVDLKDGVLTIGAEHKENTENKEQDGKYLRRERHFTTYERSFNLGEDIEEKDISAKYENGVLTLTLPKREQVVETAKRIEIQ